MSKSKDKGWMKYVFGGSGLLGSIGIILALTGYIYVSNDALVNTLYYIIHYGKYILRTIVVWKIFNWIVKTFFRKFTYEGYQITQGGLVVRLVGLMFFIGFIICIYINNNHVVNRENKISERISNHIDLENTENAIFYIGKSKK